MNLPDSHSSLDDRRAILLEKMEELGHKNIHCRDCSTGRCCTLAANSMQITPLEAMDIYFYLQESKIPSPTWDQSLYDHLQECIEHFQLQRELPSNGRRIFLRRTYTCPFFRHQSLGCSLPQQVKPYGCLGFNPQGPGVLDGENCRSDQALLQSREECYQDQENALNGQIKRALNLDWDKLPIPLALVKLHQALNYPLERQA